MSKVLANQVKELSKSIVLTFTHDLHRRVHANDAHYLATLADKDINVYRSLFAPIAAKSLGIESYAAGSVLIEECATHLREIIRCHPHSQIVGTHREVVYMSALLLFNKLMEGAEKEGKYHGASK